MKDLLQISTSTIGTETINSVNARDIHSHLEVKTHFTTWIKRAIEKYDFEENIDFSILKTGNPNGGNPILDFIATLDMAKELAMLENNPKGKETRKYFIQVEKEAKKPRTELELIIQSAQQMQLISEKQTDHDRRLENLEDTKIINTRQRKNIKDAIAVKVYSILETNNLPKSDARAYFPKLHKYIRNSFTIDTYQELPSIKYNDCMNLIHRANLTDLLK